jgi:hypothetical protein
MLPPLGSPHFLIASRIESPGNELRADVEPVARIHREHMGGRPAGRSHPDDERSSKREMVSPEVQSRVEQGNDATALGVDAREVRSFV